jgi:hypothetical protein
MPVCAFFLEGRCGAAACPYNHVRLSAEAPVCTAFRTGYCAKGTACAARHSLVCPAGAACANRAACRFHHPAPKRAREGAGADASAGGDPESKRPRRSMLPAFARAPE